MSVKQYSTFEDHFFVSRELRPAGTKMGAGVKTIEIADTPDPDEIKGFGVAITGSSCYNMNKMPAEQRKEFIKDIYGDEGLRLSVARLPIGSSDYSAELYTYDDVPGDESLEHFSVARDEAYIIPMIKEILEENPDLYIFGSPWSPPGWMKTGDSICGGYMREEFLDCYADYMIKYIDAYKEKGINVKALTPQNEPETQQMRNMPTCIWHPDLESKFILKLKEKLRKAGKDTEIWMYDHCFTGWDRVMWCLKEYPELLEECDAIAMHYYEQGAEVLDIMREKYPNLKFHFTEGGPRLYDNYSTDWCKWSVMMAKSLNHGCRSFTGWNLMLDEMGGPNVGEFGCGGLATLDSRTGELSYSGQYRAFKHFSGLIDRGAKVYKTRVLADAPNMFQYPNLGMRLEVCAVKNPDGKLILQVVNPNNERREAQVFYNDSWWYLELLPDSVSTIVFD